MEESTIFNNNEISTSNNNFGNDKKIRLEITVDKIKLGRRNIDNPFSKKRLKLLFTSVTHNNLLNCIYLC